MTGYLGERKLQFKCFLRRQLLIGKLSRDCIWVTHYEHEISLVAKFVILLPAVNQDGKTLLIVNVAYR